MNVITANAHWFLRLALASVFFYHGVLKFLNLEAFAQMLPISYKQVVFVATAEALGGLLVVLGGFRNDPVSELATRVGAALNIPVMIGAIVLVHWGRWNFVPTESHPLGGIQFQTVLILIMLYLLLMGNRGIANGNASRSVTTGSRSAPVTIGELR